MADITIRIDDAKKDAVIKANPQYDDYFNEYNVKILEESIAELKAGRGIVKTIAELEAMENE